MKVAKKVLLQKMLYVQYCACRRQVQNNFEQILLEVGNSY